LKDATRTLEGSSVVLLIDIPGGKVRNPQPVFNMISPGYFSTLNQKLLAGRDFSSTDSSGHPGCDR